MYKKTVFIKDTNFQGLGQTKELYNKFLEALRKKNLQDKIQIVRVADMGVYSKGFVVRIPDEGILYCNVKIEDLKNIVSKTLVNGQIIKGLQCDRVEKQLRIVLRNCGVIDPESILDYVDCDGYQGLKKVLLDLDPSGVINQIKLSGLRGRGGGGFPTWMKWNFAQKTQADEKYIICNADEGDPGAYMDRSVLEGDPHSVIEGMIIGGYAIGARKGYFYIRAEYPLAIERIQNAINQARDYGLLGQNILGTDFNFDLEIRLGAGAFVCGEETALIASIEGKRGTPSPRPPYPSVKGLWGKPTVINNVETLANIPYILLKGPKFFAKIGTKDSKGTKVFSLTGKVKNSGLIEVPMGVTLKDIVYDIGGGLIDNKQLKAIQTGGPSGGVIPAKYIDTPVDYDNLSKLGSIMGSGGMIVIDQTDCVVDIAKFYLKFCVDESCGKCAPCRIGGSQMLDILINITEGRGKLEDIDKLKRISTAMQKASLCGLGQTAPNPVISTLTYFFDEYKEHIENKKCPAHKCQELLDYKVIEEKCKRCGGCVRVCPTGAISGNREDGYKIDLVKCIKCGKCFEVCRFAAISKE